MPPANVALAAVALRRRVAYSLLSLQVAFAGNPLRLLSIVDDRDLRRAWGIRWDNGASYLPKIIFAYAGLNKGRFYRISASLC